MSKYPKMRSNSASDERSSTDTSMRLAIGKNSLNWSVVNATTVPAVTVYEKSPVSRYPAIT